MIIKLSEDNIDSIISEASKVAFQGGLILLPFDTVYGFLCDATNERAINKIYALKGRQPGKPLGIVLGGINQVETIAKLKPFAQDYLLSRTPGRYTFILEKKPNSEISQRCIKDGKIGIRIPESDLILGIARQMSQPLAQTSANKAGAKNTASIDDIVDQFSQSELGDIDLIIDGGVIANPTPSTLIDLSQDQPIIIDRS